jgi:hypothetical protein
MPDPPLHCQCDPGFRQAGSQMVRILFVWAIKRGEV